MSQKRFGWVRTIRKGKGLLFITLFDGKEVFQATLPAELKPVSLTVGASVFCTGTDGRTPTDQYEFVVEAIEVLGGSDETYPIQPKKHTMDFLRTIPELRGKTRTFQEIWKLRHHAASAMLRYLNEEGFTQYWTPILTQADCEGAGATFTVGTDLDDNIAELSVSGQLYAEVGAMSLGKVYTFSPCFRAEESHTKKHLQEFWMLEPEMVLHDLGQTMDLAESLVKTVLRDLLTRPGAALDRLAEAIHSDWVRVKYQDVIGVFGIQHGHDISSDKEKEIVAHYGAPVFITHYPKDLKPFYMATEGEYALCFDLIFPEVGELIGGSVREPDYKTLVRRMEHADIDPARMEWYLATRKYGSVPHAGFGLGFERLLMFVCDAQKIHDVIPFPVSA